MNIIDAIKSGKRFKRSSPYTAWIDFFKNRPQSHNGKAAVEITFTKDDILADDWEIEEKKVEVSLSSFTEAYKRACIKASETLEQNHLEIAKELGLL